MSGYLIDTNIISEVRKGPRSNRAVREWFENVEGTDLYVSVLVLGEIRRGIERIRLRDSSSAKALEKWLNQIIADFGDRILNVDQEICDQWGRIGITQPVAAIDGLLAATAIAHDLILVTRNEEDLKNTGAIVLNPFSAPA